MGDRKGGKESEGEDCGMWEREQKVNGSKRKRKRQEKKMTRLIERERAREEDV